MLTKKVLVVVCYKIVFFVYFLGIIIISDSAPVTGKPDGIYTLDDGIEVEVKDDICVMLNTNILAGRYYT